MQITATKRFRATYRSLLNSRDEHGYTPLHLAVHHGNPIAINAFAADRYALFIKDKSHKYPIAYAASQESRFFLKETMRALIAEHKSLQHKLHYFVPLRRAPKVISP